MVRMLFSKVVNQPTRFWNRVKMMQEQLISMCCPSNSHCNNFRSLMNNIDVMGSSHVCVCVLSLSCILNRTKGG